MEKRKVYRRRFIISIGLIISVLILIALIPMAKDIPYNYKTYNVGIGETIYSIATNIDFIPYGTKDIMEVIFLIRQDNKISPDLKVGQEIKIREEI